MQTIFYRTARVDEVLSLLSGGRTEGRSHHPLTARPSIVVANVSAAADPARRQVPSGRARLSGLRPQRLARTQAVRLHLRPHRHCNGDFTEALGLSHYTLYMQDYGGPVGFRMALAHPERVQALIVQEQSLTTKASGRTGQRGGHSGRTGRLMKKRCAKTCCRLPPRRRAILATIQTLSYMIPISGPMSMLLELTRTGADSERSVLRLPHERRSVPKVAGMDAEDAAKAIGHLGKHDLSFDRRAGTLSQGRTEGRGPRARRGTLRARYKADEIAQLVGDFMKAAH